MSGTSHNYEFAHRGLRIHFWRAPDSILETILETPGQRWPAWFWRERVSSNVAPEQRRSEPEIDVYERRIDDRRSAILSLPHVEGLTDVHLLALVAPGEDGIETGRYYTLEESIDADGDARTVLGEWTHNGIHRNHGTGPEPTLEAFAAALEGLPGGPSDEVSDAF